MKQRPSSRLLVLDGEGRLLLFRFTNKRGPLAGLTFWATPGGAVDPGETFQEAARRELQEETGLVIADAGPEIAQRTACFTTPEGEMVEADERYFLVRIDTLSVSNANHTALERDVMTEHRWWTRDEVSTAKEKIWPEEIVQILNGAGEWL